MTMGKILGAQSAVGLITSMTPMVAATSSRPMFITFCPRNVTGRWGTHFTS